MPKTDMTSKANPGAKFKIRQHASNREQIKRLFLLHIGVRQEEVARALGLSPSCVSEHVRAMREEWLKKPNPIYPNSHKSRKEKV